MLRISNLTIVTVFVAVALLAMPGKSWAQLPEGVTVEVLAEYPVTVGGLEKVLFRKLTLKPGASWSFTTPAQSFCQATKGELEAVNHTSGKTAIRKVGDRWAPGPGQDVTITNRGTIDHEHLFYTLIEKEM